MNTLSFEKGVSTLDLDTLKRTAKYEMAKGSLPTNRPIEHHNLLSELMHKIGGYNTGITAELEDIYAAESMAMRVMHAGKKEDCPVENYLLQRLTTRIHLKHPDDNEFNMAVGISYNEKGITMAFGPNVWVCANQNVFGNNIMQTYGKEKIPFDKMMDLFNEWMMSFDHMRTEDYKMINNMKETTVGREAVDVLYGKLIHSAVRQNMDSKEVAPLNQSQVADFIRASYSEEYEVPATEEVSVWDLQQMGTSILKPNKSDLVSLLPTVNNFSNFVINEFNLN